MSDLHELDPKPSLNTIKAVCGVTERTARRWLSGSSMTPRAAYRLLELHTRGKIMPENWPDGWRFNRDGYLETGHKHATKWQQIEWQYYMTHLYNAALRRLGESDKTSTTKAAIKYMEHYRETEKELHRKNGC